MKKIILSIAAVFAFGAVNAQIKTDAGTFTKPTTGTWMMEATMTPDLTGGGIFKLSNVGSSDWGILGIKARKFSSETSAMRFSGNLNIVSSGEKISGTDKNAPAEFVIAASVGVEKHMKGAERLSTYWGYEGTLAYVSQNAKDATGNILDDKSSKIGVGANVFTGFDYYIMPKIYLGAEVSYGFALTSSKEGSNADNVTKIELAPSITPSFRIGWQF